MMAFGPQVERMAEAGGDGGGGGRPSSGVVWPTSGGESGGSSDSSMRSAGGPTEAEALQAIADGHRACGCDCFAEQNEALYGTPGFAEDWEWEIWSVWKQKRPAGVRESAGGDQQDP